MADPTNFLSLVQRTYEEAGLSNNPPSAVTGQVNMAKKVVNWVLDAHRELQAMEDWRFDWAQVTKVLAANVDTIDPEADWAITVKRWLQNEQSAYVYKTATGLTTRQWLHYIDYNIFRGLNIPVQSGSAPIYWTVNPQGSIVYYPRPDSGDWTAVHEYFAGPETLVANTDVPRLPARYLMAIVWLAVKRYGGHDVNLDARNVAKEELKSVLDKMRSTELAQWLSAGSMA